MAPRLAEASIFAQPIRARDVVVEQRLVRDALWVQQQQLLDHLPTAAIDLSIAALAVPLNRRVHATGPFRGPFRAALSRAAMPEGCRVAVPRAILPA